ncbi:type II 3-dehydroquinate dehydratase [Roseibium denhamense]|uniref:3-dehydroquinate dehydratase n=1 Tax=Roseibium denhamense TaxID=76305 RepID=A0ABY1P5Q0_9HYPH|nr:type II 3-dehydroquinate dehydratase [Roseibium denhamense]MTI07204.1 type II 3-dehydroquinate dehydratase [Roseibium denhamense]SMP26624.1 3-dehydroquinate dehydratase [Roseibium denhamense]
MKRLFILNGPNLNLLGHREPEIYGADTLADVQAACEAAASAGGYEVSFHQSNAEHELIDWIQQARTDAAGIIINPAAYSHTSVAILDALNACPCPVIEVHISNIHRRESFRHHSFISARADAVIAGCGTQGYVFAVNRLISLLAAG